MTDQRKHRGPHPDDAALFASVQHETLRTATEQLSWLLTRGFTEKSALKLVGDRHELRERQRTAVKRCSCTDQQAVTRQEKQIPVDQLHGVHIEIDGFNLLTTIEASLASGVLIIGRDGVLRDMASMHGSYRKVAETLHAIDDISEAFQAWDIASVKWYFDKHVSNSGRIKTILEEYDRAWNQNWTVELVPDPDPVLAESREIIATADSEILDHTQRWVNAAYEIVKRRRFPMVDFRLS